MSATPPRVFISYQRSDELFAGLVREHLVAHGVRTWMDQFDIPVGAYWPDEIDRGLSLSDIVVGILSPDAVASRNVKNEWDWAIQHDKRLVLLQVRLCDVPHRYGSINFIDASGSDRTRALAGLLAAVGIVDRADMHDAVADPSVGSTQRLRHAHRVIQRRFPDAPQLAGRDDAQTRLDRALNAMLADRGQLVLLGGEAGIGKTTLITWLGWAAEERGAIVLTGGCYDLATTPPYGPWLEIIRAWPEGDGAPVLPDALRGGEALARLASQAALFELIAGFWIDASTWRPLVLVLEDLHWVDPATLDLLRHLVRPITDARIMLVMTYRDDEITRKHPLYQLLPGLAREPNATRLLLPRLNDDGLRDLVAGRYALSAEDIAWLVGYLQRQTEGNPFFSTEVLAALVEAGAIERDGDAWRVRNRDRVQVPDLVRQVIEGRLARLGDDVHRLLQVAAVIGHEVPVDLWVTVSGEEEGPLSEALDRATEARIVEELRGGDGFRFSHALIRETVYEGLSLLRRRAMHRRAGEALAAAVRSDPDMVAHHYQQAGDARAGEWLVRAGERAATQYAWPMAADRLEAALAFEDEARVRGWILYRIGYLLRFADTARANGAYRDAVDLAHETGDDVLLAYATVELGRARMYRYDMRAGLAQLLAGVEMVTQLPYGHSRVGPGIAALIPPHHRERRDGAEPESPDERAIESVTLAHAIAAMFLGDVGRLSEALAACDALETWFREMKTRRAWEWNVEDSIGHKVAARVRANVYALTGRVELAEPLYRHTWDGSLRAGDLINAGGAMAEYLVHVVLWHRSSDLSERHRMAEQVATTRRQTVVAVHQTASSGAVPDLLFWEGDWAALRTISNQIARRLDSLSMDDPLGLIGYLALHQGDVSRLWSVVERVLPAGPATEVGDADLIDAISLCDVAARQSLAAGETMAARTWIDAFRRWIEWSGAVVFRPRLLLVDAEYARHIGDIREAHRHAHETLNLATALPQPLSIIGAHRLLGQLATETGQSDESRQHLTEALTLADACAAPFERALTLVALAELEIVTGADARENLATARAICEPLEARPTLERVAALEERLTVRNAS